MRRLLAGLALLGGWLVAPDAGAANSRIWVSDSSADFSAGEARGIAVTVDGRLVLGEGLEHVKGIDEAVLFAAAEKTGGVLYVATGNAGKILRIGRDNRVETETVLPETEVTALAAGPDGALYAGTSPAGKVYRIEAGKASLHYETKAQYVWALVFSGPVLYVGTGLPGEIHRVTSAGRGERLHLTPDAHVRTLLADAKGRVWAGTSGSGLVLRAESSGSVTTVYDSSKMEVTTMTADSRGRVWAAAVSTETPAGSRELISAPGPTPAVRPSRGSNQRDEEPGAGRDRPEVTVTVSSPRLAPPHPGSRQGFQSEVILFEDGEPPRPVWNSSEEIVFGLAPAGTEAAVLAATGPKGKLYGLDPDGWSLIQTFDEKQVTFVAGKAIGTNSSSALYRPTAGEREGEYVSAVKDTGRTSRFGAFRWDGEIPPGASAAFAFRSGESAAPDSTWSSWSAWIPAAEARTVAAPPGRFLQWRVRMAGRGEKTVYLRTVEAAYRNQNAAPVVENFLSMGPSEVLARSSSGGTNVFETTAPDEKGIFTGLEESKSEAAPRKLLRKGYRTLTWKVTDPDGDDLSYRLELKPVGSERWIPLREEMRESFYSFDTTSLPDGDYLFRLQASDARGNPEDPKTSARESAPVRIDNTPPAIRRVSSSPGLLELETEDRGSPITEAEYSVDARDWVRVEPKDGLSDSPAETYAIRIDPGARGRFLLVRVTDASRNVAAASFAAP